MLVQHIICDTNAAALFDETLRDLCNSVGPHYRRVYCIRFNFVWRANFGFNQHFDILISDLLG